MEKEKLFEVKDLRISAYNDEGEEVPIVKGVNFDIHKGEVVARIGESGSGKTTIALATLGIYFMLKQEKPLHDDPVEPPPVAIAECDDQSELAGCDLDLAIKICSAQRATSRLLNSGSADGGSEIGGQRRSIYLYGKVNSQDSMDAVQLDTLMSNVRDFLGPS